MVEQNHTDEGEDAPDIEALSPLVKAYIDQHVHDAIKQHGDSQPKRKKWGNSWRSASPITKASFILSAFVAFSTIAYTIAAWRTLIVMREISSDSTQQTDKLIDTGSQIKSAAWEFKGSAQGIDRNVGNAVAKLQSQAEKMNAARVASEKQSQQSLQASIDQFHQDQRAWVSIKSVKLTTEYSAIQRGEVTVSVMNNGKTPALDVGISEAGYSFEGTPELKPLPRGNRTVQAPGDNGNDFFIGTPPIEAGKKIYIRFVVEYWDVFQKPTDKSHTTTFCGYYPSTRPPSFYDCPEAAGYMR